LGDSKGSGLKRRGAAHRLGWRCGRKAFPPSCEFFSEAFIISDTFLMLEMKMRTFLVRTKPAPLDSVLINQYSSFFFLFSLFLFFFFWQYITKLLKEVRIHVVICSSSSVLCHSLCLKHLVRWVIWNKTTTAACHYCRHVQPAVAQPSWQRSLPCPAPSWRQLFPPSSPALSTNRTSARCEPHLG